MGEPGRRADREGRIAPTFDEVLRQRRMVRAYRPEPVDSAALDRIVASVRRAPSAGYSQGHRLVVVTEEATRRAIAELAGEPDYVAMGFAPWISGAPAHVVVCVREEDYHERYREPDKLTEAGEEIEWPVPYWFVDAGAAMMLLLLAAVNEGLAAGFFGLHRMSELKALLGIPPDVSPIGVVTIGHPAEERRRGSASRRARPLSQAVYRERWR